MPKTASHLRVPYKWIKNEGLKLSPYAFKLYFCLLSFADYKTGECVIKQATLGKAMGKSRQRVNTYLLELVKCQLVSYDREETEHRKGNVHKYYVHNPANIHSKLAS